MKIIELFAGIGACSKALENLGYNIEILDAVEIDKYAIKSFNAIHNTDFYVQDIIKWDKYFEDVDIITHGSPCQDFSLAGKQAGGDVGSGTRSSLMYETIRIVGQVRPKYILWENVKNILSKKHKHNFDTYIETLKELGYNSYYQVLNAKDYSIPQNRERVFTVSIRKDIDKGNFEFPKKEELKLKLKDLLEDKVDEKYYLSERMINFFYKNEQVQKEKGNGFRFGVSDGNIIAKAVTTRAGCRMDDNFIKEPRCLQVGTLDIKGQDIIKRVYSQEGLSPKLTNMQGGNTEPKIMTIGNYMPSGHDASRIVNSEGIAPTVKENHGTVTAIVDNKLLIKNATKKRYDIAVDGDSVNLSYPNSNTRRGRVGHQVSQTLQCNDSMGVVNNLMIRKLTPKECWRLMGFDDEDFEKAEKVNSNTQLYKQARKLNLCTCFRENFQTTILILLTYILQ